MNGSDKLSIIPFTFFFFLGLYVVIKFFLVVFWTINFNPPLLLELTPFFLIGLNPVQLIILSAIVAGSDAYFHFKNHGWNIVISFIPTVIMLIGIGAAIYVSEWNNPFYYALFAIMLGVTVVDHRYLLHVNGYFKEEEKVVITDREKMLEEEVRMLRKELTKLLKQKEALEKGEVELSEEERKSLEEEEIERELEEMPEEEREKIEELLEYSGEKGKECPVCGAMNPPDAKYCKECGSELEGGEA